MNSEREDFLSAVQMPSARSGARENGEGSEPKQKASGHAGFIDEKQLLARLPISRRTPGNWKAKGLLPFIKIGRRCLDDWPSVQDALLRRQRGGQW
ncbi:MAG: hypothetical protein ABSA69_05935 [Verrucomicrobiota bacterium]|jgi:hypothetical protein